MRKKKKNEFLKPDIIIDNEEELDNLIKAENEYDESARLKKLVMLFFIPLFFILGFLYKSKFNPEVKSDKLEQFKAKQQQGINKKKLLEFNQMVLQADNAFKKMDFNKAIFLYRQAISYQPNNITLHEKLVSTLEKSCKNENEIHCNSIEKAKEKLEVLKENK
jgi:hypothetical protein